MTTTAIILADSISEAGARLTTFQVEAGRYLLPQISKHRAFSISCRSSRAVPISVLLDQAERDPVIPRFGKRTRGMSAPDPLPDRDASRAEQIWLNARDAAVARARELMELGASKESTNRLLEPFTTFIAVVSATSFDNFYALRIHPDAQHETAELATLMARAQRDSEPVLRRPEDDWDHRGWHLPYVTPADAASHWLRELRQLSAARCGRVSYVPHGLDRPDPARDLDRARRMLAERHSVPWEHQARPVADRDQRSGNFSGWIQARQEIPGLAPAAFDWSILDAR